MSQHTHHVVLPPRRVPQSACWYGECTCGRTVAEMDPDAVRAGMAGCREAQRERWQAEGRAERETVHSGHRGVGTAGGAVESGEKAEAPSDQLGASAGHHEPPVTPTPGTHSNGLPVESPNRRESAP